MQRSTEPGLHPDRRLLHWSSSPSLPQEPRPRWMGWPEPADTQTPVGQACAKGAGARGKGMDGTE